MTRSIDSIRAISGERRMRARRSSDVTPKVEPVPAEPLAEDEVDPKPVLAAHLIGQEGQGRGLRGGSEVLAKAKAAYLNAEWSGLTDRRARTGVFSKKDV